MNLKCGIYVTAQQMNVMIAEDARASTFSYKTPAGTQVILNDNIEYRLSDMSIIRFVDDKPTHYSQKEA